MQSLPKEPSMMYEVQQPKIYALEGPTNDMTLRTQVGREVDQGLILAAEWLGISC